MVDEIHIAGIEYGRATVKKVYTFPVTVYTLEQERLVRDWLMRENGWRRPLSPVNVGGGGWQLNFTYTELVADTDRGDRVSYDRRVEVKRV